MALSAMKISPRITFVPAPVFSFEVINNAAPPIPSANPMITPVFSFSFRKKKAVMVISKGVHNMSNEA